MELLVLPFLMPLRNSFNVLYIIVLADSTEMFKVLAISG